ncbi:MAG: hypothetical protein ABMA64_09280 [Myxococcota bacterium]
MPVWTWILVGCAAPPHTPADPTSPSEPSVDTDSDPPGTVPTPPGPTTPTGSTGSTGTTGTTGDTAKSETGDTATGVTAECATCMATYCTTWDTLAKWCTGGVCDAYQTCMDSSDCAEQDPSLCYCGATPLYDCFLGGAVPTGACVTEIETLTGLTDPLAIGQAWYDPPSAFASVNTYAWCAYASYYGTTTYGGGACRSHCVGSDLPW